MFYDNLKAICNKKNIKITPLVLECGGTKGVIPNSDIVMRLSVRLNVPTDVLLFGKEKSSTTEQLTADEQELLTYYKELDLMKKGQVIERARVLLEQSNIPLKEPENTIFIEYYSLPVSAGMGLQDYNGR